MLIAAKIPVNLEPFEPSLYSNIFGENDLSLSPLQWAAINGNKVLVHALIQAGASLSVQKIPNGSRLQLISGSEADEVVVHERSALIYAAENGSALCVRELLKAKANIDEQDRQGKTALSLAAFKGHLDCVRELIEARANVNLLTSFTTPLNAAICSRKADCVRELITAGADVNYKSPLYNAGIIGNVEIVRMLLDAKADVDGDWLGKRPLYHAVCCAKTSSYLDCAKALVSAKAQILVRDEFCGGCSDLLNAACSNEDREMLKFLISCFLGFPNALQKRSIIIFLGLVRKGFGKKDVAMQYGSKGIYQNRMALLSDYFKQVITEQNKGQFKDSVACRELNLLDDNYMRKQLFRKILPNELGCNLELEKKESGCSIL